MRSFTALILSTSLLAVPAVAVGKGAPQRDELAEAVRAMPMPSLQARLRAQAVAQGALNRMAKRMGFGDEDGRGGESPRLVARNDR